MATIMEAHAAELTRVGEDQRAFALIQNQMIVFVRTKIRNSDMYFASHAEMKSEPVVAGKFKEHSFAARRRSPQFFAGKIFLKFSHVRPAENPISRVHPDIDNLVSNAGVPLFAIPFDLGQLWHGAEYVIADSA